MGLNMRHANHDRQVVIEPLDIEGHVLVAWEDGSVVGTVRCNLLLRSNIGYYYQAYAINRFSAELTRKMSITTRLAIDPKYRRGTLFRQLAIAVYEYYLGEGVTHDVIDCRKPLVPIFFRLGYRVHQPDLAHPEFGDVTVLSLDLHDMNHLQAAQSPFAGVLDAWRLRPNTGIPDMATLRTKSLLPA
jgi:hypothetical protein